MARFSYPALTGWISDPEQIATAIFADFLVNQNGQLTNLPVESLTHLIQVNMNNPGGFTDGIQASLTTLFSAYFDNVTVTADIKGGKLNAVGRINVIVDVKYTSDNIRRSLGRAIELSGDKVQSARPFDRV